jgi:protein NrfD
MHELTSTRNNFGIDPQLHFWGWEIPVYLFLGGMVAGMMIISGYFLYKNKHEYECSCYQIPLISMALLSAGMVALFLDLEHKLYFWRLYTTFQVTSPMSWGSWILILVYPVIAANALLNLPPFLSRFETVRNISEKIKSYKYTVKIIGWMNMVLGVSLGIYTGILLSSLGARPLWNTSILWLLFLLSGLSAAAAFVHMIAKNKEERELLARADNKFLAAELLVIFLLIISLQSSSEAHINAVNIILTGSFAPVFWVFVILSGIILPLFIQTLAVNHKVKHTFAAPLLVIAGSLFLRIVIVFAGQSSGY